MGCQDVLVKVYPGVFCSKLDIGVGRQVKDDICALHSIHQAFPAQEIALNDAKMRFILLLGQVPHLSRGEVIKDSHVVSGCQGIGQVASYKPCAAGDNYRLVFQHPSGDGTT